MIKVSIYATYATPAGKRGTLDIRVDARDHDHALEIAGRTLDRRKATKRDITVTTIRD